MEAKKAKKTKKVCGHYGCVNWCDGCIEDKHPKTCGKPGDQDHGHKG